ncbi:hypothetical protein [Flavobacterium sp.]|uniref:hypothetical protein n=1 Tax=Flavobacterium sp. TaxID=239 RepID=UPI002FDCDE6C
MDAQIVYWIGGILISIIGYFLKTTMEDLKKVKEMTIENKSKIDLVDNNHSHLNDRFDLLYDAVKDLTSEIKNLSKELSKKKDI